MQKKTLIFTGAGMSVPLGLPSTKEFVSAVREKGKMQKVTQLVIEYLNSVGGNGDDVEWVLSTLSSFHKENPLIEYLLPHIATDPNSKNGLPTLQSQLQGLKNSASSEIIRIKKIVFNKLSNFTSEKSLSLYINLVREIKEAVGETSLSIITTNYDLTFESAIEVAEETWISEGITNVDYGFAPRFSRSIYSPAQDFKWGNNAIEYLKIHGSVDWHRDARGNCSRNMSQTIPENPDDMAILYPGFKGVPDVEPFVSLHNRLVARLNEASSVIVIGFAFRDAYINNIFESFLRMRPDVDVLYFNPIKVAEFTSDSSAPRFIKSYPNFRHFVQGIGLGEKSLGLAEKMKS